MGRNFKRGARLYESLEARQLLAGNVIAHIVNGDLYIIGDTAANVIDISGTGLDGEVLIRPGEASVTSAAMYPVRVGQNRELIPLDPDTMQPISLSPTLVNGSSTGHTLRGVTGQVLISTGDGRDLISITNLVVHRNLIIDSGAGSDGVVLGQLPKIVDAGSAGLQIRAGLGSLSVQGSLQINLGAGDDRQTGTRVFVAGDVLVQTGEGLDRPEFVSSSARNMSFSMAGGDDRLYLDSDTISGALTVLLGDGANDVQIINSTIRSGLGLVGGASIDQLRIDNSRIESGLVAVMGEASDYLEFSRTAITGTATVLGGAGDEKLSVQTTRAGTLSVDLGSGNDQFLVSGAVLDAVYAQLGDGNDWLDVVGSLVDACSAVGGGGGDAIGAFAVGGVSPVRSLKPLSPALFAQQSNTFNVGFEGIGAHLHASIRETAVPNIPYLVQTLNPVPGTGTVSGGSGGPIGGAGPIFVGGVFIRYTRTADADVDGGGVTLVGTRFDPILWAYP